MAAVALVPAAEASAQQDPSLEKLVATPQYQANIARLFASLTPDVFQRCPALVSKGSSVTVVQAARFAGDGMPVAGVWKQSFPVSGCGNDTSINFYFAAQANESIVSTIAAPGETHASLTLQRDAARYAITAVRAKAAACDTLHLRTTRFDGRLADTTGGWRETWTFSACGRFFAVPMTFIPDATGTQVAAALATETAR